MRAKEPTCGELSAWLDDPVTFFFFETLRQEREAQIRKCCALTVAAKKDEAMVASSCAYMLDTILDMAKRLEDKTQDTEVE